MNYRENMTAAEESELLADCKALDDAYADASAFDEQFVDDRIGPRDEEGYFDESDRETASWA